jgi:DNA-binding protein H-NS
MQNKMNNIVAHQAEKLFDAEVEKQQLTQQLAQAQQAVQTLLGQYRALQAKANIGPGDPLYVPPADGKTPPPRPSDAAPEPAANQGQQAANEAPKESEPVGLPRSEEPTPA